VGLLGVAEAARVQTVSFEHVHARCTGCGADIEIRSRVSGFLVGVSGNCPNCGSGKIALAREPNAPLPTAEDLAPLPTAEDLSIAVDNSAESDQHRRRTVVGVDTGRVEAERVIAHEERQQRAERWALRLGAVSGWVALVIEIWRMGT
jgi:predicted RNA-binding Zn-ribbon protein involved in translation (DUF1610 family)